MEMSYCPHTVVKRLSQEKMLANMLCHWSLPPTYSPWRAEIIKPLWQGYEKENIVKCILLQFYA